LTGVIVKKLYDKTSTENQVGCARLTRVCLAQAQLNTVINRSYKQQKINNKWQAK